MPKLRKAALVATMVGSVSMLGAGVASAHSGGGEQPPRSVTVYCNQDASQTTTNPTVGGLITVTGPLIALGDGDSSATQQICGIGNEDVENTGGTSTGGTGTDAL
ncbi:hypothetical protein [Streptomyces albidus (ex Kaewkla and Franco 2022)]|uniref:hypothetical protein n=1 Tax=Streptomyces albidus (ex Kaewkla and Franco 2022) TaxID=722709 RepID=UPI0015EF0F45|nr:hypothetical protein [Streptomyces albidus (ex Kaewkla and Franco 2022)]